MKVTVPLLVLPVRQAQVTVLEVQLLAEIEETAIIDRVTMTSKKTGIEKGRRIEIKKDAMIVKKGKIHAGDIVILQRSVQVQKALGEYSKKKFMHF